jgi:hypothetical protein
VTRIGRVILMVLMVGAFLLMSVGAFGSVRAAFSKEYADGLFYLGFAAIGFFSMVGVLLVWVYKTRPTPAPSVSAVHGRPRRNKRRMMQEVMYVADLAAAATGQFLTASREWREAPPVPIPPPKVINVVPTAMLPIPAETESLPEPVKPSVQPPPKSRKRFGLPRSLRKMEERFAAVQTRLGIPAEEARDRREQAYKRALGRPPSQLYPAGVNLLAIAVQIELGRSVRKSVRTPVRGGDYNATIIDLISHAEKNPRANRVILKRRLLDDYTPDELVVWRLYKWQLTAEQIWSETGIALTTVDAVIHEISKTVLAVDGATGETASLSLSEIILEVCTEWMLGSVAV